MSLCSFQFPLAGAVSASKITRPSCSIKAPVPSGLPRRSGSLELETLLLEEMLDELLTGVGLLDESLLLMLEEELLLELINDELLLEEALLITLASELLLPVFVSGAVEPSQPKSTELIATVKMVFFAII